MKKRFGPSLYFASDKVIFDALNHVQVKTEVIRELLLERGVLVSAKTEKYELAKYFSRLTTDFYDQRDIGGKLGRYAKKERVTYIEIEGKRTAPQVIEAINEAAAELAKDEIASLTYSKSGDKIVAQLEYEDVDYTEVEFRQVQVRDAFIELSSTASGFVVRSTQNRFVENVMERIFLSLAAKQGPEWKPKRISLQGIADPKKRTQFFEFLTKNIEQHDLVTVTEAYCFKPKAGQKIDEESDDPAELEDQPFVERVSLKGTGVDRSFVIDGLFERGYYVVKTAWRVKPKTSLDADVFELEAQFSSPETCTDFSYQVRTVFICDEGNITEKKRTPKTDEQDALFRLIEDAAKRAVLQLGT